MRDESVLRESKGQLMRARRQVKLHEAVGSVGVDAHAPAMLEMVYAIAAALLEDVHREEILLALVLARRVPCEEYPHRGWLAARRAAGGHVDGKSILRVAA